MTMMLTIEKKMWSLLPSADEKDATWRVKEGIENEIFSLVEVFFFHSWKSTESLGCSSQSFLFS